MKNSTDGWTAALYGWPAGAAAAQAGPDKVVDRRDRGPERRRRRCRRQDFGAGGAHGGQDPGGRVLGKPIELLDADHQESSASRRPSRGDGSTRPASTPSRICPTVASRSPWRTSPAKRTGSCWCRVRQARKSPASHARPWSRTGPTIPMRSPTARRASSMGQGGDNWYFLTADYSFGYDLEASASTTIESMGGRVLGSVRHPLGARDFSSTCCRPSPAAPRSSAAERRPRYSERRQAGAGIRPRPVRPALAALHAFVTDVNSIGLGRRRASSSHRLLLERERGDLASGRNDSCRSGRMPTREQAGVYVSVAHYVKAVEAAARPTRPPLAMMRELRSTVSAAGRRCGPTAA